MSDLTLFMYNSYVNINDLILYIYSYLEETHFLLPLEN
jgi:hypothetical protein